MAKKRNTEDADEIEVLNGEHEPPADGMKAHQAALPHEKKIVLARDVFPSRLPIIPVDNRPLFPKMVAPMIIDAEPIKKLLQSLAQSQSKFVGLVLRREHAALDTAAAAEAATPVKGKDIYKTGVIAEMVQIGQTTDDGPIQVLLGVLERFRITQIISEAPYIVAEVRYLFETEMSANEELKAYSLSLIQSIKELMKLNPLHKEELRLFMSRSQIGEPGRLADFAAALTTASGPELQEILETTSILRRIEKVLILLKKEMDITKIQVQISKQIEKKISKHQREFFLREQLKAIKKELGLSKETPQAEHEKFAERLKKLTLPDEAKERIEEEMEKLKLIEPVSPEFNVTRNYLDWLTSLPWGVFTEDNYDIKNASRILDEDHYGLRDVKERILEFLSVGIKKGSISGSIMCFIGPPGVGKTSVGRSIARSMNRRFYRFSIGGIRDEAEIKGHRRTYIGALPGKFVQAIKVCKSANPVIMLDEVDKIGASYQGDPASALLEVLDPEQNRDFLDHYLDVRFDLSNVLFICTGNLLDPIPRPLLDRMEVIKLPGYIHGEKVQIAKRFLIPKQLKAHGITSRKVKITDRALRDIIDGYAREPGVRGVEKHIKKIFRKSVRNIVEGETDKIRINVEDLNRLLGKRLFSDETPFKQPKPGVVMGLAWTSMGGDVLHIEAARVEDEKAGLQQTGQLGNVMVESCRIAYTFVRSFLNADERAREFFGKSSIHVHVPAGATPKDGPSAGITIAAALYSLAQNKPVRRGYAMTGELTLTGLVMPIGGVKEKVIAAKRAKVRQLIFPTENKKDFDELPEHIKKGLHPYFVATFAEVVDLCL